jgi:putative heme-binding domain-containing protein
VNREPQQSELESVREIDLAYDLGGVETEWQGTDGTKWSGSLPHFDLVASRAFTRGSAEHETFADAVLKGGTLTMRGRLRLADFLRPAVQPGSTLDYSLPPEKLELTAHVNEHESEIRIATSSADSTFRVNRPDHGASGNVVFNATPSDWIDAEITYKKPAGLPALALTASVRENDNKNNVQRNLLALARPVAAERTLRRWALPNALTQPSKPERPKELEGGSWAAGRRVFHSEQALCAKCHTIDGAGGAIGPNLSNLRQRDYASVLRDVTNPNYAINPDYISYTLRLEDGRVLSGTVRSDGDALLVGDEKGDVAKVARADVAEMKASTASVMPKDVHQKLGDAKLRDLLTYLLTPPPSMPLESPLPPPAPRSRDELAAVLAGAPQPPEKTRLIRVVLVAGPKDHGPGEHDYPAWQKAWKELLALDETTIVETAWEWPSKEQLAAADALVVYQHGRFDAQRAKDLDAFLARGGGATFIPWAVDGNPDGKGFAERIGLAVGGAIGFRHGDMTLDLTLAKHPIVRGFDRVRLVDETYWKMVGDLGRLTLLGTAVEDGAPTPQMWVREHGKGRVFVSIPGHYSWSFDDPLFRVLLLRGIAWTAREPVDRYNELVPIGARMRP